MAFDIDMIKKVYSEMPSKVAAARQLLGRPLTLAEKILYAHLSPEQQPEAFERGKNYVNQRSKEVLASMILASLTKLY